MLDYILFEKINQFAGTWLWLDTLGIFFAKYFGYILIFFIFLFLLKDRKKYWPMVIIAFSSAILAKFVITEFIRFLWNRPRPFVENQTNLLLDQINAAAFPSGHAAFFFALSLAIYFYNKKAGIIFLIASFLISISRVFCGIHWPTDILAGALVGIFSGWLINSQVMKFFKK
ncbi:MAG: phosphatase PAP2 family protein [Patescibacteria group bacterium]|nr:phosphatase PAP2 family protein [Patescibacteria group bacterium]